MMDPSPFIALSAVYFLVIAVIYLAIQGVILAAYKIVAKRKVKYGTQVIVAVSIAFCSAVAFGFLYWKKINEFQTDNIAAVLIYPGILAYLLGMLCFLIGLVAVVVMTFVLARRK